MKKRTTQQNRALHLYYKHLADELNNAGLDVKETLAEEIDIPWSPILIKELIWRKVQRAYTTKISTTELTTKEINELFDIINRHLGEKFGLHIPFPSIEALMEEYET